MKGLPCQSFFHIVFSMFLCPTVLKPYCLVENQVRGRGIRIHHKVANTLELEILSGLLVFQVVLYVAVLMYLQTVRIEELAEVAVVS